MIEDLDEEMNEQKCKCNHDEHCKKRNCECGDEGKERCCNKDESCECNSECNCGETCECTEEDKCSPDCKCGEVKVEQKDYLADLIRLQAEFDNYRKRMMSSLGDARQAGFIEAIEGFLPALDSFKMATDMITDKNTLMGIKFIEKGILDTLSKMGVEVIDATGKFDPNLHTAIDTDNSADVESGMIVKEAYKGFTYKGKVIRHSQVIVKK